MMASSNGFLQREESRVRFRVGYDGLIKHDHSKVGAEVESTTHGTNNNIAGDSTSVTREISVVR